MFWQFIFVFCGLWLGIWNFDDLVEVCFCLCWLGVLFLDYSLQPRQVWGLWGHWWETLLQISGWQKETEIKRRIVAERKN